MPVEAIRSLGEFYGTSLASRVSGYDRLSNRITWSLGAPMVNVELHQNQLYENISIAVEMFTKFAGYTEEYLVFDTNKYEHGKGLRLDKLFSITPNLSGMYESTNLSIVAGNPNSVTTMVNVSASGGADVYTYDISDTLIDPSEFNIRVIDQTNGAQSVRKLLLITDHDPDAGTTSGTFNEYNVLYTGSEDLITVQLGLSGTNEQIVQLQIVPNSNVVSDWIQVIVVPSDNISAETQARSVSALAFGAFDPLLNQYRKVMEVINFDEGSTTGVNTLFTIEQTLAQQTYFSYAMGQYGFDLISWYTVKEWLDLREKLLTIKHTFVFDPHTQYLRLYPEPDYTKMRMYGIVSCYLEKKIEHMIHEPWIYQYALALCKITLARVRGKYGGTSLFGGGDLDISMLQEGLTEKEKLETQLYEQAPGFGDADPPMFFVG